MISWQDEVLVGGNHLASSLVANVGPDFAERFPPDTPPDQVFALLRASGQLGPKHAFYDMWVCWATIMRARDLMDGPNLFAEVVMQAGALRALSLGRSL